MRSDKKVRFGLGLAAALVIASVLSGCQSSTPTPQSIQDVISLNNSRVYIGGTELVAGGDTDIQGTSNVDTSTQGSAQIVFAPGKFICALNPLSEIDTSVQTRPDPGTIFQQSQGSTNVVWGSNGGTTQRIIVDQDIFLESMDPAIRIIVMPEREARIAVYQGAAEVTISGERGNLNIAENKELRIDLRTLKTSFTTSAKPLFSEAERNNFRRLGEAIGIDLPAPAATVPSPSIVLTSPKGSETSAPSPTPPTPSVPSPSITVTSPKGAATSTPSPTPPAPTQPQPEVPHTVTINLHGEGSVVLSPPGGSYEPGTTVTLSAFPDSGWGFYEWEGSFTGSENPVTLTMNSDKVITASFIKLTIYEWGIPADLDPFLNTSVRQAVCLALNEDSILDAVFQGDPSITLAPEEEFAGGENSVKRAKQLLSEAGYPDGFKLAGLAGPASDKSIQALASVIQKYLAETGITIQFEYFNRVQDIPHTAFSFTLKLRP